MPKIYVLSRNIEKYNKFSSENYHFYSREKSQKECYPHVMQSELILHIGPSCVLGTLSTSLGTIDELRPRV